MTTLAAKAARYLLDHPDVRSRLMIERGIGYWISPDGEFIPTPPRTSHADIMRTLISEQELDEDDHEAFTVDPNPFAQRKGWTRVRIYPGQRVAYVDSGAGRRVSHAPAVDDLLRPTRPDRREVEVHRRAGELHQPVMSGPPQRILSVEDDIACLPEPDEMRRIPRNQLPDMPDRMIAATALHLGLPLITIDARIRRANIQTIW